MATRSGLWGCNLGAGSLVLLEFKAIRQEIQFRGTVETVKDGIAVVRSWCVLRAHGVFRRQVGDGAVDADGLARDEGGGGREQEHHGGRDLRFR